MKKIIITTIICALGATSSHAGFGDFLKKAADTTKSVTSVVSGSSLDDEQEQIAKQLGMACADFATAKAKAFAAAGNTAESDKYATLSNTLKNETNLTNLAAFVDGEKKVDTASILKNIEIKGEDQKALIAQSVQAFSKGLSEEIELGKGLAQTAQAASEAIKSASAMDKVAIASKLTPLINLSNRFPQDIKNAKETLKLYMDFAKKNGIDISGIASSLIK